MIKKILLLLFLCATSALHAANYLTFTAEADSSSFGIHSEWGNNPDVQYSLDGGKTWTKLTNDTLIPLPNKKKALLRGYNPQGISRDFGEVTRFVMTGRIAASGSVMSLIDNVGESVVIPNDDCFRELFRGCVSLTKAPKLPAIYLTSQCYESMFQGCVNMTNAPELPAMRMTMRNYAGMFAGCKSLKKAPKLPATYLGWEAGMLGGVYGGMFAGCTSLTKAPKLPATTLNSFCYEQMFEKCTNLTQAPELPAKQLARGCYDGMFRGCTGLTQTARLPENVSYQSAFTNMYEGCDSIPQSSPLRDKTSKREDTSDSTYAEHFLSKLKSSSSKRCLTITAESNYVMIFISTTTSKEERRPNVQYSTDGGKEWKFLDDGEHITLPSKGDKVMLRGYNPRGFSTSKDSYTRISINGRAAASGSVMSLIDGTGKSKKIPNDYCFANLFNFCDSLTQAPELPATQLANYCYTDMFKGCSSLKQAPELPATKLADGCYSSMFDKCASLTQAPELPATELANYCYGLMFHKCTNLTQAPKLPATQMAIFCYYMMFAGCVNLKQAPELPATQLADGCYLYMFTECTSLTEAPKLPATRLETGCYMGMFSECKRLKEAPKLPAIFLSGNCYFKMFKGCTSLTHAPQLPATQLAQSCYSGMFNGCSSLTEAPELPAISLFNTCYSNMFEGCTSLTQAPELPSPILMKDCYKEMFKGCTSLTQAPALNATRLVDGCYTDMFKGCTSLKEIPELPEVSLFYRDKKQSEHGYKVKRHIVSSKNDTIHLDLIDHNIRFKTFFMGINFKQESDNLLKIPTLKGEDRFLKCEGGDITNFSVFPLDNGRGYLQSLDIAPHPLVKEVKLTATSPEGELLVEVNLLISNPTFYLKINNLFVEIDSISPMPSFKEYDDVSFVVLDERGNKMEVTHRDIKTKGAPPIGSKLIEKGGELSIPEKKWILSSPHNPFEIYIQYKNKNGDLWSKWMPFFRVE